MRDARRASFETRLVRSPDVRVDGMRPSNTPIVQTTNFHARSSRELGEGFRRRAEDVYTRFGHPTLQAAARQIAEMEEAEAALIFSSGMAAITTSLLTLIRRGSHVVSQRAIFAQTFNFLEKLRTQFDVCVEYVDTTRPEHVRKMIRPETSLIYAETPSNPLLRIVDIVALGSVARASGLPLLIDGTFASPYIQNPLSLGASLVLHSASKFLGGHSDVLCGAAAGDRELIHRIKETQILLGGILDPHAAWLLMRGMKTLALRVRRQSANALELAGFLEGKEGVRRVHYPFLDSSPYRDLARRQMKAGGGVFSFEVEGGLDGARAFVDALQLIPVATSLGGVETVIEIPWDIDFGQEEMGDAAALTGIAPGLIRLAVGIEAAEDLKTDLETGLGALRDHLSEPRLAPGVASGQ